MKTKTNYKDLAQILVENASELSIIGKSLQEDNYAVVPVSMCNDLLTYDEALEAVNKAGVPVCIVRVVRYLEKGQQFGIVRHALSRLNGKKVLIGRENESGLIRCSDIERRSNVDYVHKSFIQIL